jgi:hypothetical protein
MLALTLTLVFGLTAIQPLSVQSAQAVADPFTCEPNFYLEANSSKFYKLQSSNWAFSQLGTATNIPNGIGWNPDDNYIYGVAGTSLFRISNDGVAAQYPSSTVSISGGTVQSSGGDFLTINGKAYLVTVGTGFSIVDVTANPPTVVNKTGTFSAKDVTNIQKNGVSKGYGIDATTLYIATYSNLTTVANTSIVVTTKSVTGGDGGTYGAAFADGDGNAYFLNNTTGNLFELTSTQLASASTSLALLKVATASLPSIGTPDGASCPSASSPTAPAVITSSPASSITSTSAAVAGTISTPSFTGSNVATGSLQFCYATSDAF